MLSDMSSLPVKITTFANPWGIFLSFPDKACIIDSGYLNAAQISEMVTVVINKVLIVIERK